MICKLLIGIMIFLMCKIAVAAPVISSVSNSSTSENEIVVITGESLNSNALDIEWLGGAEGTIEKGSSGNIFSKPKWEVDSDSSAFFSPRYTSEKYHSGSKAIVSQYQEQNIYGSGFQYDHGSKIGEIYVSWWVYFNHIDSQGQWKKWRLSPSSSYNDKNGEVMQSDWYDTSGGLYQTYMMIFCDKENYSQCYPNGISSHYANKFVPPGKWVRLELYAKESSISGIGDGTIVYNMYDQENTRISIKDYRKSVVTRISDNDRWQYFEFQNYWGNITGGDGTKEKIYIDDVYIQVGKQNRVEIGDNISWNNCKHTEIQLPTKWTTNSITFTVNQGSFNKGDKAYLFVVDENGVASEGKEIRFGACQGPPAKPGATPKVEAF